MSLKLWKNASVSIQPEYILKYNPEYSYIK